MLFKLLKPLKEDKAFKEDSLSIILKFPPIVSRLSNPSKDSKEELAFTSKSPPMLFKPFKPLKEDSAITLKFPPIVSKFSNPSKDAKEEDLAFTSKSPPILFKLLKPLKEDKTLKE